MPGNHELYEDFVARLGESVPASDTAFVNSILNEAEDDISDYIGRRPLPEQLNSKVVKYAVEKYNQRGIEGESSRSEGGISRTISTDIPAWLKTYLDKNYPRKVGYVHAISENANSGG